MKLHRRIQQAYDERFGKYRYRLTLNDMAEIEQLTRVSVREELATVQDAIVGVLSAELAEIRSDISGEFEAKLGKYSTTAWRALIRESVHGYLNSEPGLATVRRGVELALTDIYRRSPAYAEYASASDAAGVSIQGPGDKLPEALFPFMQFIEVESELTEFEFGDN